MKKYLIPFLFCVILFSCSKDEKTIAIYKVAHADFKNVLVVDGYVEPVKSTTLNCPMYIEGEIDYLIEDGTFVKEGDTLCIIKVQELQTSYDQTLVDLENGEANRTKLEADLNLQYALLEAQVKNNEADTEIAQLDSLQLKYSTPKQRRIKELQLEKTTIEKNKLQKKLEALKVIQQSDLKRMELENQQRRNNLNNIKSRLDALVLKAPTDGLAIRNMSFLTRVKMQIGDPVWSNMPIVSIPVFEEMKVKIMAPERDYKLINMEDSVTFTFSAMPGEQAVGKITKKAPVGQPIRRDSKVKYFEIEASIDSASVMPDPGFTAVCSIILQQEENSLFVPQIALFDEDSTKVVYVKKNKNYEMREVKTGLSSSKEIVITDGLEDGETISLSKPSASSIKKKTYLPKDTIPVDETPVDSVAVDNNAEVNNTEIVN